MKRIISLIGLLVGVFVMIFFIGACSKVQAGPPGPSGIQGPPGVSAPGVARQINATVTVSKPANGTNFVAGEAPVLTITLKDQAGNAFDRANDFSQLRLLASGPMETTETITPVKLLKTTADRTQTEHHYINLISNADVQVNGNVLTYKLGSITDEKPGTYTASVWAVLKTDGLQQAMPVVDFQIGTPTVEEQIVTKEKCSTCHLGANSGKFYLHHIDPAQPGQAGNWSLDLLPVQACKVCHNNDGYAAYTSPVDSKTKIPDPIVKRVHGVHMGEELANPANINPQNGIFRNYTGVIFPANIKNCTACHVDDRWKTQPSRSACGSCHDNVWFGDLIDMPSTAVAHPGGPRNDDTCSSCHRPDGTNITAISVAHEVSQPMNTVELSVNPPANGKFYVAGEAPKVTIVIKDDNGNPIDHTKVDNSNYSTANFFVYGNRENTVPVLSSVAKNGNSKLRVSVSNSKAATGTATKGWTFTAGDTFKIAVNGNPPVELAAPVGLQTPAQVREWLAANLKEVTVTASATNVSIKSNIQGENSQIVIYNSNVTTIMGWKASGIALTRGGATAGVTMEPYVNVAKASYPSNDLRKLSDPFDYADPAVVRSTGSITYQLDDVNGLPQGTYSIYVYVIPAAGKVAGNTRVGIGFLTFQIGTATEEKQIASNCSDCHADTIWHLDEGPIHPEPFNPDYCKACHDYGRPNTGNGFVNQGGTSLNGWSGFGAVPLSRRVHGVHYGAYLEHPEQIYSGNPNLFGEIIFPQDIRNCEKCHDPKGSQVWKEEPSRLACMACHDSDSDNAHAILMTSNPDPDDQYNSKAIETCQTCHGVGKDFAVDKVHSISNPYKPPYLREPEK